MPAEEKSSLFQICKNCKSFIQFLDKGFASVRRIIVAYVNVSLQVLPTVSDDQIYTVVDKVIELIQNSGCKYEVGPMETTMEGELDELLEIVKKAQKVCINEGASRVISVVKIDYKPEGVTIDEKISKYRKK